MHSTALPSRYFGTHCQCFAAASLTWPVSWFEFTLKSSVFIGQWTICLTMKTARQNIVNQSENGYGWDNYTDYELSIAIHSIKCVHMQDTNEQLSLTCGVTAAHCHWSRARSESDHWPVHTRFKGKLNSWHRHTATVGNVEIALSENIALGRVHTGSGSVPDSSEPYASGRLRVGFAFTLLTTEPTRTVRVRFAVYTLRLLRDRLLPNYMHLTHEIYQLFRVMGQLLLSFVVVVLLLLFQCRAAFSAA